MGAPAGGQERKGAAGTMVSLGVAALAVVRCSGLPLVASLVGGLTLAGVLGVSVGVVIAAAAVVASFVVVRARRRRACEPPPVPNPRSPGDA